MRVRFGGIVAAMPIHYEADIEHVVLITIDRPESRNSCDMEHFKLLREAWERFAADDQAWVAIITTPVGAHLEAVTGGVEALLVPPGDADALAAALARLLDDQGLRLRLGRAARARYAAGFAIEPYATRLAALHEAAAWRTRMERPKKLTAPLRGAS